MVDSLLGCAVCEAFPCETAVIAKTKQRQIVSTYVCTLEKEREREYCVTTFRSLCAYISFLNCLPVQALSWCLVANKRLFRSIGVGNWNMKMKFAFNAFTRLLLSFNHTRTNTAATTCAVHIHNQSLFTRDLLIFTHQTDSHCNTYWSLFFLFFYF